MHYTGLAFSLPPSPEHACANSPVEFVHDYLFPSPRVRDTVSFRLDDILLTAASDSEDFEPALADALPPSGQEVRPSATYSELVDMLSRATEKLALDWPDEPRESRASKLDERFLSGPNSKPEWRKLPFFSDLHQEISRSWKQPFSSRLTNAAAADFTNLVGSVEQGYTDDFGHRCKKSSGSCGYGLYALCTPNCKSLWIKASAKLLNVNVNVHTVPEPPLLGSCTLPSGGFMP